MVSCDKCGREIDSSVTSKEVIYTINVGEFKGKRICQDCYIQIKPELPNRTCAKCKREFAVGEKVWNVKLGEFKDKQVCEACYAQIKPRLTFSCPKCGKEMKTGTKVWIPKLGEFKDKQICEDCYTQIKPELTKLTTKLADTTTCALCYKILERTSLKMKLANGKVWCPDCFACSVCGVKPTIGKMFGFSHMGLIPVTLCDTHSATFASCKDKKLEELPDELLSAQLTRLNYLRELDVKHANEALQAALNPGKMNMVGQVLSIISLDNGAANWWQLDAMKRTSIANSQHQVYMNRVNSLDTKIAEVKDVIRDRKQLKVLQQLQSQKNNSERSSDDAIAILKVRFAKGEIDKNQYEEALKLIISDAT